MKKLTTEQIVMSVIGEISPVGESNEDTRRLENIKEMTDLVDTLVSEIARIRAYRGDSRYSVDKIGSHADRFLCDLHSELYG